MHIAYIAREMRVYSAKRGRSVFVPTAAAHRSAGVGKARGRETESGLGRS